MEFNRKKVNSDKGAESKTKLAANDSESAGTSVFRPGWNRRSASAKKIEGESEKVVRVASSQNKDDLDRGENIFQSKKKLFIIAGFQEMNIQKALKSATPHGRNICLITS
jgi:hypothetical protein